MCACAGLGFKTALALRDEQRLWRAWVLLLQRIHAALRYTAAPLQEILCTVDRSDLQALGWLSEYDGGETLVLPQTLKNSERAFAVGFFAPLGTTDLEGQLAHIEQYLERALQAEREARATYKQRGKAYVMTGISVGLCVGLALI